MPIEPGQSFGNFSVVGLVGEGAFGAVYEAQNPLLQRRAAIKLLHPRLAQDPELVRRFLVEARAASAIRHPNIIEIFDAGMTPEGAPYILMEFLEGESLQKRLSKEGRLALPEAMEVVRQTGAALSAAHAAGIVHRDLKPENIFLIPDATAPSGSLVKVLDFGIAKVKSVEDSGIKTQLGVVMGSPRYMSPEQCRDSTEVDQRSDIYSLAVIVYEMLTGAPPFQSNSAAEMLGLQLTAEPPSLRHSRPDLDVHVDRAVLRALAKDRRLRPDSVLQFVDDLCSPSPSSTLVGVTAPQLAAPERGSPLSGQGLDGSPAHDATVTTLKKAAGETSEPHTGDEDGLAAPRARHRAALIVAGIVASALVAVFALRPSGPTSPPTRIVGASPDLRIEGNRSPDTAMAADALPAPPARAPDAGTAWPSRLPDRKPVKKRSELPKNLEEAWTLH